MNKTKNNFLTARRATQAIILILFIYIIWTTKHPLKGFINPLIFFHLDPFVMIITAIAERIWLSGLVISLITLAFTFIFGRVFCGWFCPMGTVMDLWQSMLLSIFKKKPREKDPGKGARKIKYYLLGIIIVLAVFGIQSAWIFDPITIFVRTFSFNVHPFINNSIEQLFAFVIQATNFFPPIEMLYFKLKGSFLSVSKLNFPHTTIIFLMFLAILGLASIKRRFWCRYLCPLGAMLALTARFSPFKRIVYSCKSNCGMCKNTCRTNAIKSDMSYLNEECIVCLDCTVNCPEQKTSFTFSTKPPISNSIAGEKGITRSRFFSYIGGSLLLLSGTRRVEAAKGKSLSRKVLRPPASLDEEEFVQRCIRCGNCMKVCITNVLQPAILESGWEGIWTPRLDTVASYCEYKCVLCGRVCPTGAINPITVEEKMLTKIGVAKINRNLCLPWAKGEECIVCEEHCPISDKAIKMSGHKYVNGKKILLPEVINRLCVGCGICEAKCPVNPKRAINVGPYLEQRIRKHRFRLSRQ